MAKPSTAAIIGLEAPSWRNRGSRFDAPPAANAFRSIPEQNPRPAPVTTAAVSPSSSSSSSTAPISPSASSRLMALRASGRLRVMRRTRPRRSVRTSSATSLALPHLGGIRMPPSTRIVSPFM
jgi:hypothetical protein